MKVSYDATVDVFRILLSDKTVFESDEEKPGVILDYDGEGNLIGAEILEASSRTDNPAWSSWPSLHDEHPRAYHEKET